MKITIVIIRVLLATILLTYAAYHLTKPLSIHVVIAVFEVLLGVVSLFKVVEDTTENLI